MPAITIRALGAKGVNVDASPSLLDDAELRDSQNFFHESTDAHGGALRTRRGFTPFVLSSLGAPILGGIGMAVRGTARATGAGGGPGTGGTGPGTGGPPGETGPTGTGIPTGPITPTGPIFGGARIIAMGRSSGASSTRYGTSWFITSENISDAAIINTGPPGPPNGYGQSSLVGPDDLQAGPAGIFYPYNGWFYYWGGIASISGAHSGPQIRRTNGYLDELVVTVPHDSRTTGVNSQILSFAENKDFIWFTETSNIGALMTGTSAFSRLFRLDPASNTLVDCKITGSSGAQGYVFNQIAEYNGRMFVGENTNTASGTSNLIPVLPTSSGAVIDAGVGTLSFGAPERDITSICKFDSSLYVGTQRFTSGGFAHIYAMSITATGAWTATSSLTGVGGTGAALNRFPSMIIYKSKLYASYFNPVTSTGATNIFQFDGTTWTSVFTGATVNQNRPFFLFVDKDTLYAIGAPTSISTGATCFLQTTDGATGTWNDKTTGVAATTGPIVANPMLFGFEQS
jgi:hypothetical protein